MSTAQTIVASVLWVSVLALLLLVLLLYRQVERAYNGTSFGRSGGLNAGVEVPAIEIMSRQGPQPLDLPSDEDRYLLAFVSADCSGCKALLNTLADGDAFDGVSIGILVEPVPQGAPLPQFPSDLPIHGAASPADVKRHFGITSVPMVYVMHETMVLANGLATSKKDLDKLFDAADKAAEGLAIGVGSTLRNGNGQSGELREVAVHRRGEGRDG